MPEMHDAAGNPVFAGQPPTMMLPAESFKVAADAVVGDLKRRLAESAAETALLKDLCLSYYMAYTHDEAIEAECYDLWLAGAARCGALRAEEVSDAG